MSVFDPNGLLIPIKPIKQINKNDCSIACLMMLLDYYGINVSREEISNFIIKEDGGTSFNTEMARFVKNKGLNVDCLAYNLYITDPKIDKFLDKKNLLKRLESKLKNPKLDKFFELQLKSTIAAVNAGVDYQIKKPDIDLILSYLDKSIPLSVTVNYAAFRDKQFDVFEVHDIVLCGKNDKELFFVDPEDGEIKSINYKDFIFAFFQRKIIQSSSYLLAIQK